MKLEAGKTYLTRDGRKAKVTKIDLNRDWPYKVTARILSSGDQIDYTLHGRVYSYSTCILDLVQEYIEPKQEITMQEQQKPLFEVGKTYKDGEGTSVKIVYIHKDSDVNYSIIGIEENEENGELIKVRLFTHEGRTRLSGSSLEDLVPPEPPLPIVVGGFYLDNCGDMRVLLYNQLHKDYRAASVFQIDTGFPFLEESFPKHSTINFELVKLLTYEEAIKLIREKLG